MLRRRRDSQSIPVKIRALAGCAAIACLPPLRAFAQTDAAPVRASLDAGEIVLLSALIGTVSFAVMSAIALMRGRNRAVTENGHLRLQVAELKADVDRFESLATIGQERIVIWEARGELPLVIGDLPSSVAVPRSTAVFLAFGTWLTVDSAGVLDAAVTALRERGEAFDLIIATQSEAFVEVTGRTVGGRAIARFRDLTGDRLALARIRAEHGELERGIAALRSVLDAVAIPVWQRGGDGRLCWVNNAFATAVDAATPEDAVARGAELLDTPVRAELRTALNAGELVRRRVPAVIGGQRHMFDVVEVPLADGSAGLGIDATERDAAQATLDRVIAFHAETLDQLATAVAIYGPDRKLRSANAAFRNLFDLDPAFLASEPEEGSVLDRLRAMRKLPEQADFRNWKAQHLSAYQALGASEYWWHLPDGQTLRVIANPHPQGGVTWIYENVTERLDLESRYNALIRVQGETLDHLSEGVAVFGPDGRLRLNNPSFARIWQLAPSELSEHPHISTIVTAGRRLYDDAATWQKLTASIAGLDDERADSHGRMERNDRRVVDYSTVPLPDGQTMVTFVDITDSIHVERALTERNQALEAADDLKTAFIQHVSYELRSPLTNIIGFTQLLTDPKVGVLNDKQREYTGYVMSSSAALLAIVNDILDLATIDAGIIELDLAEVDVAATIQAAVEGVQDRVQEAHLKVMVEVPGDIGLFRADERRIRQVLYNLLSNAISYSSPGGSIRIAAERAADAIAITVADQGAGIPPEFIESVFNRFESRKGGASGGGAGLGLSIVKSFVELHGGRVDIDSKVGRGTTVTVRLPIDPEAVAAAAE